MMATLWNFAIRAAGTAFGLWIAAYLGIISVHQGDAFLAAIIIVLLNMTVRPILGILGLPITIVTLGLFSFVLNGIIVLIAAWIAAELGVGLLVNGFWSALCCAIFVSITNWIVAPFMARR